MVTRPMKIAITKAGFAKLDSQQRIALKELAQDQPTSLREKRKVHTDLPVFAPEGKALLVREGGQQLDLF